jgi:PilZ domain
MMTPVPRATRVALTIPIMYRRPEDDGWIKATVVNLSDSGVLFGVLLGPTGFAPGTPVEVILSPPFQVGSLAIGKQFCAAEVVRATEGGEVAARFEECRFLLEDGAVLKRAPRLAWK